jgi:septum formation protein
MRATAYRIIRHLMHLILASASPRRAELLRSAGYSFDVAPSDVDETVRDGEAPKAYALRVAREKSAVAIANCRKFGTAVLAADTVVVAAGQILAKPEGDEDAKRMLKLLAGAVHEVHTAVVLCTADREVFDVVTSRVRLLPLTDAEIEWYIGTGEPQGKAGAYGIQGRAARFIDWIDGSWSNVVGLPVSTVYTLLKTLGHGD